MYRVRPGSDLELSAGPITTGLVGTIGVRIMDGDGNVERARSTAGIIEQPAGSGVYVAKLAAAAPTVAGRYQVVWDTGGGTPEYAVEDLEVLSTHAGAAGPTGEDLCTLDDVRLMMQFGTADDEQDDILQLLITRASRAITRYARREFIDHGTHTRRFEIASDSRIIDLAPYDARTVTAVTLDPDADEPVTVSVDDFRPGPLPNPDGVYRIVKLHPRVQRASDGWGSDIVAVTGAWGFASIPDDVVHAAVVTVVIWTRRDVSAFTTTYDVDQGKLERPEGLPSAVRAQLCDHRLDTVG